VEGGIFIKREIRPSSGDDDGIRAPARGAGTLVEAQVDAVYRQAPITHSATALVALLTVFVIYAGAPLWVLLPWAAAVILLSALRLAEYSRYLARPASRSAAQWARRYWLGATVSGVLWGFAAAVFYSSHSQLHQAYILLVVGGLVAAASVTQSVLPPAFYGFALPALFALAGRIAFELATGEANRSFVVAEAALVAWYVFALHRLSRLAYQRFVGAWAAQSEIRQLADDLLLQKQAVERSNRELQTEIDRAHALETELHQSRQRLGTALSNIPAIVWVTDRDGRFTLLEGRGLASLGTPAETWMDKSVYSAFPAPCALGDAVRDALSGREHAFSAQYEGRIFQTFSGPLREPDGSIAGALGVSVDVSEREQMKQLQRFRAALEASAEGIFLVDRNSLRFIDSNETACRMLGTTPEELAGLGPLDLLPDVPRQELEALYDALLARPQAGNVQDPELRLMRRRDGSLFPAEVAHRGLRIAGQRVVVCVIRDISEQVATQERLRLAYQVLDNIAEAVLVSDARAIILWVNPSFERLTGYRAREACGQSPAMLKSDRHEADFYANAYGHLRETGTWQGEAWARRQDGTVLPMRVSVTCIRNQREEISHYVAIFQDVSQEKQVERRIEFLATHDALTGLPNRTLFWEELHGALLRGKRERSGVAVFFIDLDEFKRTNDTLGHLAGDAVLKAAAQRLRDALRDVDLIGRLGGDEFAVAIEHIVGQNEVEPIADKVLRSLAQPLKLPDGHELTITASMGISLFPRDGQDVETLLKHSDVAMYRAKAQGRHCFRFFSQEMTRHHLENLRMESGLRRALEGQTITVSYQPRIEARSGAVVGLEALARWNHEQFGDVPPQRFIPLAENTGLIYELGDLVLRTACRQLKAWDDAGLPATRVAVNVSAKEFREASLVGRVTKALHNARLNPAQLEIEVTESSVMADLDVAAEVLGALTDLGVHVSLDDFGTGHSSLAYLQRFPIDAIKIDRSFVMGIESQGNRAQLTHAVITLGHSLGLRVIAEGVETPGQLRFLQERRCDEMQGFLLAAPMSTPQCEQWLSAERAPPRSSRN
jgi:diguanylate cyclase (GGDEF)-like protein/PAS domain S-box-containing protein